MKDKIIGFIGAGNMASSIIRGLIKSGKAPATILVKDIDKVKLVHGKGLRIQTIHPSDEGIYVCEASNLMGAVTAAAKLTVSEPPVPVRQISYEGIA